MNKWKPNGEKKAKRAGRPIQTVTVRRSMGLCKLPNGKVKEDQPLVAWLSSSPIFSQKGALFLQPKGLSKGGWKVFMIRGQHTETIANYCGWFRGQIENIEVKLTREGEFLFRSIYKLTHDNISILLQQFSYGISYLKNSSKNFHDAVSWGEGWQRKQWILVLKY